MEMDRIVQEIGGVMISMVGFYAHSRFLRWINNNSEKERSRLYYVDSQFIDFMEHMGDFYNFTHMAIWTRKEMLLPKRSSTLFHRICSFLFRKRYLNTEHLAFIARGTAKFTGEEKHSYFIAQFEYDDFISNEEKSIDNEGTEGYKESKPFLALFTDDKKMAALSIVPSPDLDVWVSQKFKLTNEEKGIKQFVYKDKELVSGKLIEEEWNKMGKPMKLRELNDCIYSTFCSGKKYDVLDNNCLHFVRELWKVTLGDPLTNETVTTLKDYEERGKQIATNRFCSIDEEYPRVMSLPVPQNIYVDNYSHKEYEDPRIGDNIRKRDNIEAAIRVYRSLERLKKYMIVLNKFKCNLDFDIKKTPANVWTECDFLIITDEHFVVVEVKNTTIDGNMVDAFKNSLIQGDKVRKLIQSIYPQASVLLFTAFPSMSSLTKVTEVQRESIIFSEDLDDFAKWWQHNVPQNILHNILHITTLSTKE
ncbi:uncharacterized protein LOC134822844 [Bolinopsis microptera]|uniref:uncharacterized protein LOC134822844 n=1 Tax=Bolinopsis microptera TaxID=2820187 RepID=UPI00307A7500